MIDTCICCGEVIPEGRMVCKKCEALSLEIASLVWENNLSEIALNDFSIIQKGLNPTIGRNIYLALLKLQMIENNNLDVLERKE